MVGCASGVTFNRVQPLGQKSVYKMQNNMKSDASSLSIDRGSRTSEVLMSAILETDVTSNQPDGSWTITNKISQVETKVDGKDQPEASRLLSDKPFSFTMDQAGKILKVAGAENLVQGMNIEQMFSQISPSAMLPNKPVNVGDSWPFEIAATDQGGNVQTMTGVGTLRALNGDEATMDFDFIVQITMNVDQQMSFSGNGKGKTTAVYDTEKARFISNKSDVTIETTGKVSFGEKSEAIKNSLSTSMQIELVNK
jgi:hypothetical protein